ncbi:ABC transporter substrate-binding protein [Azospirillum canadense]|uniref:ABC transporter substrate-binding protein n=1 Tax=Azospirillum canadense TaxID=403962 RepID=UPI002226DA23|nr:ABC transporter substrate-binding protein [Azospirillum canadense]MCW2241120.1 branched-chain amino acid transport system substrate-binding protein [Azospirillum canadense]
MTTTTGPNTTGLTRRTLLTSTAGLAVVGTLGAPAIVRAQSDVIRVGHLTPRTGFLGPLGEYAVMGVTLAVEEINAAGGVLGRKVELLAEDSVNPSTAATKAERMIEREKVAAILGEISSASGLSIAQVAGRNKTLFIQTGCNSDELRGKSCNRYMFHIEGSNTAYVKAVGQALLRDGMVKGKKWFGLTADYAFGHDLLRVTKKFAEDNGGSFVGSELVPTDASDFSPFILKIRQAKPDLVVSNLAGNQITNFIKQYNEYGLPFPIAGGGFDTAAAWGAGPDAFTGTWPCIWHHTVQSPSAQAFTQAFTKRWGKPPENQAWGDYLSAKVLAQAMAETKSTESDKIIAHLESQAKFDVLKGREGYFRNWDHQLIAEMYTITPKPKAEQKDKWDMLLLGTAVPGPNEDLETIQPTKQENACTFS